MKQIADNHSNQFNMMSNMFENFNNFVNINIDTRGNHFHFSSHMESSDDYDTENSSESWDSDAEDYFYEQDSEGEGLNEDELDMITKVKYRTSEHGSNQY